MSVGAPFFKEFGHVFWDWALEVHLLPCAWMAESKRAGMECLARACLEAILHKLLVFGKSGAFQDLVATIASIVEEGMTLREHVDSNLMGPAGLKHAFHTGDISEALHHFVVGDCMLSNLGILKHCHLKFVSGIAGDIAHDGATVSIEITPYQRDILTAGCLVSVLEA